MEQSDLDLLQTVPLHHFQMLIKMRHLPLASIPLTEEEMTHPAKIEEFAHMLFDADALKSIIANLEPLDALILDELVACGGRANSRDLALYFSLSGQLATAKKSETSLYSEIEEKSESSGAVSLAAPSALSAFAVQYPAAHPHGLFEQALRRLLVQGLVFWGRQTSFAGREYASGIHDGVLIVPIAVRSVVRAKERPVPEPASDEPLMLSEGMHTLQRKLYLYWSFVAATREKLTVLNTGLLTRASLRHVVEHMETPRQYEITRTEQEFPYLLFLRLMLTQLGLLQLRSGTLHALPAQAFFAQPLLERARRCYHLWLDTPFWNEMAHLPDVVARPGPVPLEPAHEEVLRSRSSVVERLLHERVNEWLPLAAFIARTKLYIPHLLFPRQYGPRTDRYSSGSNPYGWDFRLRRGWLTHREGWHLVEGGFIRTVIAQSLHWLGILEVDREENSTLFRLAASASAITNDEPLPVNEEQWGRLIVQPNFELIALAPISESLLVSLDCFAERVSLDVIAQYRISKASVTRAVQMGMHTETILEELTRAAGGEIPQNVRYSLTEWERQARRIEIWQDATLIEVDDDALLDALFADDATRALFGRRLTPRLAEVNLQQLDAVQALLWQRDYLPALAAAPTQDAVQDQGRFVIREPQWQLHTDGLLQPLYAVIDLYLAAEIGRLSERDETTGWQKLTAAALQKALQAGFSLDYMLRFLQHYCLDGIPPSLSIRLKLWGNGYGEQNRVAVEQQPLLRLSAQVAQDLQLDTELAPLLGSEVEQPSSLIRVKSEQLARVLDLLRERGFEID